MLVRIGTVVGCGAAVGFLTGFLGVGGGFLVLPVLVIALRMPVTAAIGTSLLIMVLNAAAALASRSGDLAVDWAVVVPFTLASVVGTLLGRRVADRLSGTALTRIFAVLLLARRNLRGRRELARRMRASHSHGHAHGCAADHHRGEYTERQRADLDLVLAFNHRLTGRGRGLHRHHRHHRRAGPGPAAVHVGGRGRRPDPGPARPKAAAVLDAAPRLVGQTRGTASGAGRGAATPPGPASPRTGRRTLVGWLEWQEGRGDRLVAALARRRARRRSPWSRAPRTCSARPRPSPPTARPGCCSAGRSTAGSGSGPAGSPAVRWSEPEPVSDTDGPSFNQEVFAHPDGSLHVCWQGRVERPVRRSSPGAGSDGAWARAGLGERGGDGQRVGPDPHRHRRRHGLRLVRVLRRAATRSRCAGRRRRRAGPVRRLTGGSDYALHPSLATTTDGRLWCAFDVITVHGHGGSGPDPAAPAARDRRARPTTRTACASRGDSVPPELLPEVSAAIRVVCVDGRRRWCSRPASSRPGSTSSPSALPRLQATADGGLVVGYRVHRQLPLMTYYWEAAAQVLGAGGLAAADHVQRHRRHPRGGRRSPPTERGVVLATQTDGRLERALHWTEGFGGRECPYLADHHGAVIWHGVHGAGQVVLATVERAGPALGRRSWVARSARLRSDERQEARRWVAGRRRDRSATRCRPTAQTYHLYWGDLHRHSLVSRCTSGDEPSLEDFYRYAWDVDEYDFWAVTDHAENSTAYQWWSIQKIADLLHVPGRFVPLYGFEWTSADHGHQNVIYGDVARGAPIFSAFAEGTTDAGRAVARARRAPGVPGDHHPAPPRLGDGAQRLGLPRPALQPARRGVPGLPRQLRVGGVLPAVLRRHRDRHVHDRRAAARAPVRADRVLRPRARRQLRRRAGPLAEPRATSSRRCGRGAPARRPPADVFVDLRLGPHLMGCGRRVVRPAAAAGARPGYTELARVDILRDGEVVHVVRGEPDLPPGHRRVDLRVEWGKADNDHALGRPADRRRWPAGAARSRRARGDGAWTSTRVAWQHVTHSFGEPYGAQRGGVEVSVCGPGRRAGVDRRARAGPSGSGWPSWPTGWPGPFVPDGERAGVGELALQPAVGALLGLGVREVDVDFTTTSRRLRPSTTRGCSRWTASWRGRRRSGCGRRCRNGTRLPGRSG